MPPSALLTRRCHTLQRGHWLVTAKRYAENLVPLRGACHVVRWCADVTTVPWAIRSSTTVFFVIRHNLTLCALNYTVDKVWLYCILSYALGACRTRDTCPTTHQTWTECVVAYLYVLLLVLCVSGCVHGTPHYQEVVAACNCDIALTLMDMEILMHLSAGIHACGATASSHLHAVKFSIIQ